MAKHVAMASVLTAGILIVFFMTWLRPGHEGEPVDADASSMRLQELRDRMGLVERDILRIMALLENEREHRDGAAPEAEPAPRADLAEEAPSGALLQQFAALRGEVRDLGYRVHTLEEDPINRGYAFLQSENAELRRQGIGTLARLARFDPVARDAIRQMLGDENGRVRMEALQALTGLGDKESIPMIAGLLGDGDANMRRQAIDSLSRLGAKDYGDTIAAMLRDPSERVREGAADVMGRLGVRGSAPLLIAALGDENQSVVGEAIASLGEIGAREAVPQLRQLYDAGAGRHLIRVVRALRTLGDAAPFNTEVRRLSQTALAGEDGRARARAVEMLSMFAPQEAREVFVKLREDPDAQVRRQAERALGSSSDRQGSGAGRG